MNQAFCHRLLAAGALIGGLATLAAQTPAAPPPVSPATPALTPVAATPQTPFATKAGTWTLSVLPDTQHEVAFYPDAYRRQIDWIVENHAAQRIRFVSYEGDMTNNNSPAQWTILQQETRKFNRAGLAYALVLGNKDYGENGKTQDRSTLLNDYFTAKDYASSEAAGFFEEGHLENSWHLLDTPTGPYLLLALEFGPRDEVLEWAGKIADAHPARRVIVVTHACLYNDGQLHGASPSQGANPKQYGFAKKGSVNDGVDLWNKLISVHSNIVLVLNGHSTKKGAARLTLTNKAGKPVTMILANYQQGVIPDRGYGGGGYLRLMRFLPDDRTVEVQTYSPWYDHWLEDGAQAFSVTLPERLPTN